MAAPTATMIPALVGHPSTCLFEAVVAKDYEGLSKLYATNARNSVVSYLSMRSRWAQQRPDYAKSEEKLDEFLQQKSDNESSTRDRYLTRQSSEERRAEDTSFYHMLQDLGSVIAGQDHQNSSTATATTPSIPLVKKAGSPREADRLVWESSSILSDLRPPSNFCVYNQKGAIIPPSVSEDMNDDDDSSSPQLPSQMPPIFDGSVANATPPPLGGASGGASGGAGTVLHLACAMDLPLMLAFLLIMGADGRASHTAFRRLMIHEAACNGSIQCLTLLLELGQRYATQKATEDTALLRTRGSSMITGDSLGGPFFPHTLELPSANSLTGNSAQGFVSRPIPPIAMNIRHLRRQSSRPGSQKGIFMTTLRQFQSLSQKVSKGEMSELDAARALMEKTSLLETTQSSLIRSCSFSKQDSFVSRTFLRPHGCADGHGNTPLHWAAFKNETQCVSLLLQFKANPNARAHPSGWTPLHDAAYSNSSESIELLVDQGAHVDARANSGATPLCFAAQEDASNTARLLLRKGADLTTRCAGAQLENGQTATPSHPHSRFSGYTPLHYCAHYNAHKASKVLLEHSMAKVAMETPDLSGRLPIHVAVARGSSDVLRTLLHAGARIDIRPTGSPGAGAGGIVTPHSRILMGGGGGINAFFALPDAPTASPVARRPPSPEVFASPTRNRSRSQSASSSSTSPVTSPVLRSMIPQEPISSSKPWNCLTQQAIDECEDLIFKAEQSWSPDRHLLFTPPDRKAVMELLRVGKRLEQQGVLFIDLWPQVLNFCGRGWFEVEGSQPQRILLQPRVIDFNARSLEETSDDLMDEDAPETDDRLSLPYLSRS